MILKITQPDSDASNTNDYFDALRQRSYEASFDGVKGFIIANKDRLPHRRHKKPLRKWQWVLAILLPVVVVLACTKTERTEAVGQTVTFSVPVGDGTAIQALEPIIGGLQTVISPDRPGYLSYTAFLPAQGGRSADAVISGLKAVKGITGLSMVPVNAQVRESLLSQLGANVFSTHVPASGLDDAALQKTVNQQLKEKGFHHITVTVTRNKNGVRMLELHPTKDAPNYFIDLSLDDKGTRMVLQEEKRTLTGSPTTSESPAVDFGHMTDAQVRDYFRRKYGAQLDDESIKITRTAEEISIEIKQSDKRAEIMRFKLK